MEIKFPNKKKAILLLLMINKKKCSLSAVVFLVVLSAVVQAQSAPEAANIPQTITISTEDGAGQPVYDSSKTGSIEIIQDPRLPKLLKKRKAIQKGISGYRVQIFFGAKKNKALEIKTEFSKKHPAIEAHLIYVQPYFKIRVGDFLSRLQAEKILNEISIDFPDSFIVNDLISIPELD